MRVRSLCVTALLLTVLSSLAYGAPSVSPKPDDPKDAVYDYIAAEGRHDWDKLASVTSPQQSKAVRAFAQQQDTKRGAFRVKAAKLKDIKELPRVCSKAFRQLA
jgi:hypothetical protein